MNNTVYSINFDQRDVTFYSWFVVICSTLNVIAGDSAFDAFINSSGFIILGYFVDTMVNNILTFVRQTKSN